MTVAAPTFQTWLGQLFNPWLLRLKEDGLVYELEDQRLESKYDLKRAKLFQEQQRKINELGGGSWMNRTGKSIKDSLIKAGAWSKKNAKFLGIGSGIAAAVGLGAYTLSKKNSASPQTSQQNQEATPQQAPYEQISPGSSIPQQTY